MNVISVHPDPNDGSRLIVKLDSSVENDLFNAMVERCKLLGNPVSTVALCRQLLLNKKLTPREAKDLRAVIDANEVKSIKDLVTP